MKGASIKFVILAMIGMAVIGGCVAPSGDKKTETVGQNVPATTPTPASTSGAVTQPAALPDWLKEKTGVFGKYFEIDREKLPLNGAGLKLIAGNDDKYDDGEMKVGDGVPELMAGINVGNNEVILVADEDFFVVGHHGTVRKVLSNENKGNPTSMYIDVDLGEFMEVFPGTGIYYLKVPNGGNDRMVNNKLGFGRRLSSDDIVVSEEEKKKSPLIVFEKVADTPAKVMDGQGAKLPDWLREKTGILGGKYYEIDRAKLPLEGAGLKLVAGNDDKYDDGEMKVGDGVPELMAGIQGDNIALVVDRDFFEKYNGEVKTNFVYSGGAQGISMKEFTDLGNGLYYVLVPIGGKDQMGFSGSGSPKTQEELRQIPGVRFEKK